MCDIYGVKCTICGKILPMHLGDFDTGRDEVEVACGRHIPEKNASRIMVWFIDYTEVIRGKQDYPDMDNDETWNEESVVYVKALTDNAWKNRLQNNPNIGSVFGIPLRELDMFHYGLEMWTRGQISESRSNEG